MNVWSPGFLFHHNGSEVQAVLLQTDGLPNEATVTVIESGTPASTYPLAALTHRPGAARIPLVPQAASREVTIDVRSEAGEQLAHHAVTVRPARRQTVHLFHHAHQDMGWCERPTIMRNRMTEYLDEALDLIAQTAYLPHDARFRWNVESAYLVRDFEASRPAPRFESLLEAMRTGSIEMGALWAGVSSELHSTAQLSRLTRAACSLRATYRVPVQTAFLNDVPGWAWSLPSVLAQSGVRQLVWGPDPIRAMTHLSDRPPLYWASGPDGRRVLTWQGPFAYIEAWPLVFHAAEASEDLVDRLLAHYQDRGFYPYEDVLLHAAHDFNPPQVALSEFVRDWNALWTFPRFRMSLANDFFDRIRASGFEVPVLRGAFPDAWTDGVGSAAAHSARKRAVERRLGHAETLSTFAQSSSPREEIWRQRIGEMFPPMAMRLGKRTWLDYPATEIDAASEDLLTLDEHTWGAVGTGDRYHSHARAHWLERELVLTRAESTVDVLMLSAGSLLAKEALDAGVRGVVVINPTQFARTDLVTAEIPLDWAGEDTVLVDLETGTAVDSAITSIDESLDIARVVLRPAGGIPGFGYRTFSAVSSGGQLPPAREITDGRLSLEAATSTITVDPSTGGLSSWVERGSDRELVRHSSRGLNAFELIVRQDEAFEAPEFEEEQWTGSETWDAVVDIGRWMSVKERMTPEVVDIVYREWPQLRRMITVRSRIADVLELRTSYIADDGSDSIRIRNVLDKRRSIPLEAGYFAFPFALEQPAFDIEGPGYTFEPGQQLSGSMFDHYAAHRWVRTRSADHQVLLTVPDAPLVCVGGLHTDKWLRGPQLENAEVYSYAFNQSWWTNFPSRQLGRIELNYSMTSGPLSSLAYCHEYAAREVEPLSAFSEDGAYGPATLPPMGAFLEVSGHEAQVVSVAALGSGRAFRGVKIGIQEVAGSSGRARIALGTGRGRILSATRVDLAGEQIATLAPEPDSVEIPLEASEVAYVDLVIAT